MSDLSETDPPAFAIDGPMPQPGLTLIEASAGTGKTWTLTSLVVRFVAEGTDLSEILAVTFTKIATGELRDRIRRRLMEVRAGLTARLSAPGHDDPLVEVLASGGPDATSRAIGRIDVALADFDAATIATTHSFCQMVLHGLGSAGDAAADSDLLEDPRDLVREVVDDLYLRRCVAAGPLPFEPPAARKAAEEAVSHSDSEIFQHTPGSAAASLGSIAGAAREEVARRLVAEDRLTYDEMLTRLARTLDDPVRGPQAALRLSRRYQVVLVDEFQDTDPVQWRIVRSAFAQPCSDTRLILIGDPKQAIYAFRGADVNAYLEAATQAHATFTLGECRRSDQPLLDAITALFQPTLFGNARIPFRRVSAPEDRQAPELPGAPLRFRVVADEQPDITKTRTSNRYHKKDSLLPWVARDVAADIAAFLATEPDLPDGTGGTRPLQAADIAVLTRFNRQANMVRDALRARGVPAVLAGTDDVFTSGAANDWLRLLDAIQEPANRSRMSALALSHFVGMTATDVAGAGEEVWEELHAQVKDWALVLANGGVGALYRRVSAATDLPRRVLGIEGGERTITDLGHVAELLHAEAGAAQLGPASLRTWLATRIRHAGGEEAEVEERSRRLDSDAAAVQILTIHRAKGLEFNIVYCPFLWDSPPAERSTPPVVFHDPETRVRVLDTGGCNDRHSPERQAYDQHAAWARAEDQAESLRLMYVALTRARHRLVVWWAKGDRCGFSPLGRVLLSRHPETGEVSEPNNGFPDQHDVEAAILAVKERAGGAVSMGVARLRDPGPAPRGDGEDVLPQLELAHFGRSLDQTWRRASYTSITAGAHRLGQAVGSEPEDAGITDEPAEPPDVVVAPAAGTASPWADLAGGAAVGTFVHRTLELTDFAGGDLPTELHAAVEEAGRHGAPDLATADLVTALEAAITTPFGGALGDMPLASIERRDRLDELGFELPVAGGDHPTGEVTTRAIADAIGRHLGPGDRMAHYAQRLHDPDLASVLRGYLVGSLDLVFRRSGRWYVVDYKTNWLGPRCEDYGPGQLDDEMAHRHYPLQAILYMVALHRYLRWRQPGYRPEEQLGGVYYLFLRGMAGPDTPSVGSHRCGVFDWPVPPALVVGLSDLLDGPGAAS